MALMKPEAWQDLVRNADWTFTYVDTEAVFPDWQVGSGKVPMEAWQPWEESYKVTYPEYVATQREKESVTYGVKAALSRSKLFDNLDVGWKSMLKMHFGAVSIEEYLGTLAQLRVARFGLNGGWRNMGIFGALDEIRHNQIHMSFAHEFVADPQYDWAQKAYHTNDWATIALRGLFDGMDLSPNVVDLAIQLPLTFETGFTNLQFVALAADALASGDVSFANMISTIQTDEARHAQQGFPTLEILAEHDPDRAQWVLDKMFWFCARAFAALSGPAMDYYTPIEHRKHSYKEFMEEWIIDQFIRTLGDYGLKKPWFWDEFIQGLDVWQHSLHLGFWFWRPTVWWNPKAGVSRDERAWLQEKYPRWEQIYGPMWDQIIDNLNAGNVEATLPETLPILCNTCHLPNTVFTPGYDGKLLVRDCSLVHNGVKYHFCSKVCRQIWWEDRDTLNHKTLTERFIGGEIQPATLEGVLSYMGLTPDVMGTDAEGYRWAEEYRGRNLLTVEGRS